MARRELEGGLAPLSVNMGVGPAPDARLRKLELAGTLVLAIGGLTGATAPTATASAELFDPATGKHSFTFHSHSQKRSIIRVGKISSAIVGHLCC